MENSDNRATMYVSSEMEKTSERRKEKRNLREDVMILVFDSSCTFRFELNGILKACEHSVYVCMYSNGKNIKNCIREVNTKLRFKSRDGGNRIRENFTFATVSSQSTLPHQQHHSSSLRVKDIGNIYTLRIRIYT